MSDETPQQPSQPDDTGRAPDLQPPAAPPSPPVAEPPTLADVAPPEPPYPVTFTFDGPEQLSRLSTFFRLVLIIPVILFLALLSGGTGYPGSTTGEIAAVGSGVFGGLVLAYLASAFVRGGRPVGWLGSVLVAIYRFQLRAYAYFLLLTDKYPAFEGDWYAQFTAQRPERISRRQMLVWKFLTSIPHFFVIIVLFFAVAVCEVIGWFAILFTGRFPRGLRDFVVGWLRWQARVYAYLISLRDEFPPYSLSHYAGPGSTRAKLFSGLGGIAVIIAGFAAAAAIFLAVSSSEATSVSYTSLTQGAATASVKVTSVTITLHSADDGYDFPGSLFKPDSGSRFVEFELSLQNGRTSGLDVEEDDFRLKDDDGHNHDPVFVSLQGALPPRTLKSGQSGDVTVIFAVENGDDPSEFKYSPSGTLKDAEFDLR